MYAASVIAAREAQLLARPAFRKLYPQGIPSYSIADSRALTASCMNAVDDEGKAIRKLSEEEQTFVGATRLRITFDYPYFAERFVWIDEEGHGLRPLFPLWESQRFTLERLAALEASRVQSGYPDGLLANVLKARQLGISTLSESLVAHRLLTRPYIRALAGADVEDQAGYLFRMVDRLYQQLPWFLKPGRIYFTKNREMTFSNQSFLKTAWGKSTRGALTAVTGQEGSKGAIGRGQTYSVIHISELATWENPEQLDTALLPTVPYTIESLVVFESTAEFAGDWWHLQWQAASEGAGRFINIFIPWYAEPTKYSLPAPVDWSPSTKTLQVARKCEADAPRWLGRSYTLTRDQLYWYERTRDYYQRKGELYKFLKEYPCDDQECFQYAGRAIFTIEQLEAIDAAGSRRPLLDVWHVEPAREIAELRRIPPDPGPSDPIPARRRPEPPLAPRVAGAVTAIAHEAFPVPPGYGFRRLSAEELKDLPSLRSDVLAIWEYPRARGPRKYVMSVDVAEGLGADYSVIGITRLQTIEEPAEQVASYISNLVDTKQLAFICDAIGRLYVDEEGIEALAAIETNGPGLATQDTLQLHLGYSNFYVWEYADAAQAERRFSTKIGWATNSRTRPLMLAAFHAAITNFDPIANLPEYILNSPITRGELRHFVTEGTIGDAAAARGQHDDCVMEAAIGYYVSWRLAGGEAEPISERRARRLAMRAATQGAPALDWRNSPSTSEEMDHGIESDDEFTADVHHGSGGALHFDPRSVID